MTDPISKAITQLLIPLDKPFSIQYRCPPGKGTSLPRQYDVTIDGLAAPETCDSPDLHYAIALTWLWYVTVTNEDDESEGNG